MDSYRCPNPSGRGKIHLLVDPSDKKCPACGGTDGEVTPAREVAEGLTHGTYYNFDARTGGRAKKRRRKT